MVSWGSAHRLHVCCPSRLPGVVPARHPEAAIRTPRLAHETTALSAEHTQQADNLAVPSAHTHHVTIYLIQILSIAEHGPVPIEHEDCTELVHTVHSHVLKQLERGDQRSAAFLHQRGYTRYIGFGVGEGRRDTGVRLGKRDAHVRRTKSTAFKAMRDK